MYIVIRLTVLFVIFVLLTGVMLMSIPDNAFAGKDEKRVNISVKDGTGKNLPNISCIVFESDGITFLNQKTTNNGGKAGIWFPETNNLVVISCNGATPLNVVTLKHTTAVLIEL